MDIFIGNECILDTIDKLNATNSVRQLGLHFVLPILINVIKIDDLLSVISRNIYTYGRKMKILCVAIIRPICRQ